MRSDDDGERANYLREITPVLKRHRLSVRRNVRGALDCSRVACDLEGVKVLLELNGPAAADRPNVGDLCFAFLSLPVKPEVIVTESHNFFAAVGLKNIVRVKDQFVETRR